jgi:hypothetical protein
MEKIYRDELIKIYKENAVFPSHDEIDLDNYDKLNEILPLLHNSCLHREKCWKNIGKQDKNSGKEKLDYNRISYPYIGEEYKNQVLCIGINLYDWGGWNALKNLFCKENGVIKSLEKNKKRMNFGVENYRGTLFFHRLAVYASIILEKELNTDGKTVISQNGKNIYDDFEVLVRTVKKIVFVEAVKCSPKGNRSCPTWEMLTSCPQYFLLKEILVLKPEVILILSKEVLEALKEASNVIHSFSIKDVSYSQRCGFYELGIEGQNFKGFWVIHPTAPKRKSFSGGVSTEIACELFKLKKTIQSSQAFFL